MFTPENTKSRPAGQAVRLEDGGDDMESLTRAERAERLLAQLERICSDLAQALDRLDDLEDRLDRQRRPWGDGHRAAPVRRSAA